MMFCGDFHVLYSLGTQSLVPAKSCDDSVGEHENPSAGLLNWAAVGVEHDVGRLPLVKYGGYADVEL